MGYRLNSLDEPVFMAGPKLMRTEFGICQRLESCGSVPPTCDLLKYAHSDFGAINAFDMPKGHRYCRVYVPLLGIDYVPSVGDN